jgi:hypothetical protein
MSIEYISIKISTLSDEVKKGIISKIENSHVWSTTRNSENQLGINFGDTIRNLHEDITVEFNSDQIYIAFHIGTGYQRQQLLKFITRCLLEDGINCIFEEV